MPTKMALRKTIYNSCQHLVFGATETLIYCQKECKIVQLPCSGVQQYSRVLQLNIMYASDLTILPYVAGVHQKPQKKVYSNIIQKL